MNNGQYGFPKNRTKIPAGINSITNNVDNNLVTATGGDTLNGENGLTFNNGTLNIVGQLTQGRNNQTPGDYSHAEGDGTQAIGVGSHAEGKDTQAGSDFSHAEGYNAIAGSNQGYLATSVAAGTCSLDSSYGNVSSQYSPGDIILFNDSAYDDNYRTQLFVVYGSGFTGTYTYVTFTDVTVNTTTSIIGNLTYGAQNWAGGYDIGGAASHAEGFSTISLGDFSHAEGRLTQTIGKYSHAEGRQTQAIGESSHAEGVQTIASGSYSHAEGNNTIASGSYQHVSGQFNTQGDTTSLFIVGNGVSVGSRSDAFKVTPSGSIILPTTVSSTPGWTGVQGEMVFGDNSSGTYRILIWLNGGWRSVSIA
jgi:hypothetical protein